MFQYSRADKQIIEQVFTTDVGVHCAYTSCESDVHICQIRLLFMSLWVCINHVLVCVYMALLPDPSCPWFIYCKLLYTGDRDRQRKKVCMKTCA